MMEGSEQNPERLTESTISNSWVFIDDNDQNNKIERIQEGSENGHHHSDSDTDGISVISESDFLHDGKTDDASKDEFNDETIENKGDDTKQEVSKEIRREEEKLSPSGRTEIGGIPENDLYGESKIEEIPKRGDGGIPGVGGIANVGVTPGVGGMANIGGTPDVGESPDVGEFPDVGGSPDDVGGTLDDVEDTSESDFSEADANLERSEEGFDIKKSVPSILGAIFVIAAVLLAPYFYSKSTEDRNMYDAVKLNHKGEIISKNELDSIDSINSVIYCFEKHKNDDMYRDNNMKKCLQKLNRNQKFKTETKHFENDLEARSGEIPKTNHKVYKTGKKETNSRKSKYKKDNKDRIEENRDKKIRKTSGDAKIRDFGKRGGSIDSSDSDESVFEKQQHLKQKEEYLSRKERQLKEMERKLRQKEKKIKKKSKDSHKFEKNKWQSQDNLADVDFFAERHKPHYLKQFHARQYRKSLYF